MGTEEQIDQTAETDMLFAEPTQQPEARWSEPATPDPRARDLELCVQGLESRVQDLEAALLALRQHGAKGSPGPRIAMLIITVVAATVCGGLAGGLL